MEILLTGSSSMLGTRVFETLLQQGYGVTGIDYLKNRWKPELNHRTLQIDLTRPDAWGQVPSGDMIIHLAPHAGVYGMVKQPDLALENIGTTFNLLEFARKRKVQKIIFSSSYEIYGNLLKKQAITEDRAFIQNCESPYAANKFTDEAYIHSYATCYGLQSMVLRFSNIYGMYDVSNRVIPLWISQLSRNKDIVVYGTENMLDFIYIDDCVDGILRAIQYFPRAAGQTFNIGSGKDTPLMYVAQKLSQLLSARSRITPDKNRTGEIRNFRANISKAKKYLGYSPTMGIDEGLIKTVAWYQINMSF